MWLQSILATIMWGFAPLFERVYLQNVTLYTILLVFTIFILLTAPVILFFTRKIWMEEVPTLFTTNKHVLIYGLGAFIVSCIAFISYLGAIQNSHDKTYVVVAVTCSYPLVTAALFFLLLHQKITLIDWIGIVFIVIGILLLSFASHDIFTPKPI